MCFRYHSRVIFSSSLFLCYELKHILCSNTIKVYGYFFFIVGTLCAKLLLQFTADRFCLNFTGTLVIVYSYAYAFGMILIIISLVRFFLTWSLIEDF